MEKSLFTDPLDLEYVGNSMLAWSAQRIVVLMFPENQCIINLLV